MKVYEKNNDYQQILTSSITAAGLPGNNKEFRMSLKKIAL